MMINSYCHRTLPAHRMWKFLSCSRSFSTKGDAVIKKPQLALKFMNYQEAIQNKKLLHDMSTILSPSVHDSTLVIQRDAERHCSRLHTVWLEEEQEAVDSSCPQVKEELVGFVGYGRISVELPGNAPGVKSPVFYFGLGSACAAARTWKLPDLVSSHFLDDLKYFAPSGTAYWGCVMAAVPTGMKGGIDYFTNREGYPRIDGSYTEEAAAVARAIAKAKGWESLIDPTYPFLIRGVSGHVQFTAEEIQRTKEICAKFQITVFEKSGMDTSKGDRVLFVGKVIVP